jgi:hypothetical protein
MIKDVKKLKRDIHLKPEGVLGEPIRFVGVFGTTAPTE